METVLLIEGEMSIFCTYIALSSWELFWEFPGSAMGWGFGIVSAMVQVILVTRVWPLALKLPHAKGAAENQKKIFLNYSDQEFTPTGGIKFVGTCRALLRIYLSNNGALIKKNIILNRMSLESLLLGKISVWYKNNTIWEFLISFNFN